VAADPGTRAGDPLCVVEYTARNGHRRFAAYVLAGPAAGGLATNRLGRLTKTTSYATHPVSASAYNTPPTVAVLYESAVAHGHTGSEVIMAVDPA